MSHAVAGHPWIRQVRLHQWVKNLLLFVPLFAAHQFDDVQALVRGFGGFAAFSMVASAVYIANDIADVEHDRKHRRKHLRPIAAGVISLPSARAVCAVFLALGLGLGIVTGWQFAYWLVFYLGVTTAYTFLLKRMVIVDAIALAALYALRIVAGGAATSTPVSQWLLSFSLFIFLSLAIAKRYVELVHHLDDDAHELAGRGYRRSDAAPLMSMGIASGFASALVLTLYVSSPAVIALYAYPSLLWLTVPVLVYWMSWLWLCAHRGDMHDDPVVFSLTDRRSQLSGLLFVAVLVLAAAGGAA